MTGTRLPAFRPRTWFCPSSRRARRRGAEIQVAGEVLEQRRLLTVFVDVDATGVDDGSSWQDAFNDLQDGLAAAALSGDDIWVAEGVYTPGTARTDTFQLNPQQRLFGGFVGTESALADRDWVQHQTILSGDLNGDDQRVFWDASVHTIGWDGLVMDILNNDENAYTVVTGAERAVLDGFIVEAGNSTPDWPAGGPQDSHWQGGGMFNADVSPLVRNTVFRWNEALAGGAMANVDSQARLAKVVFHGNLAETRGGAMFNNHDADVLVANSVFVHNQVTADARAFGGAIHNADGSDAVIYNVTMTGNWALLGGGAIANFDSDSNVVNSILWGDGPRQTTGGTEIYNDALSTPQVVYSDVMGGYAGTGNIAADPRWVNAALPAGVDGRWMSADDGLRLSDSSVLPSPAIDAGTFVQAIPPNILMIAPHDDILHNPRPGILNSLPGRVDMGAYEVQLQPHTDPEPPQDLPLLRGFSSSILSGLVLVPADGPLLGGGFSSSTVNVSLSAQSSGIRLSKTSELRGESLRGRQEKWFGPQHQAIAVAHSAGDPDDVDNFFQALKLTDLGDDLRLF